MFAYVPGSSTISPSSRLLDLLGTSKGGGSGLLTPGLIRCDVALHRACRDGDDGDDGDRPDVSDDPCLLRNDEVVEDSGVLDLLDRLESSEAQAD